MNCYFINLSTEIEKRRLIEANFKGHVGSNINLNRFEALDINFVTSNELKGTLTSAEKACFSSHRALINKNIGTDKNLFIMEDDIIFSNKTIPLLNKIIASDNFDWDIIYTDICVPEISLMRDLFLLKEDCRKNDQLQVIDLRNKNYASAAAYVVNKNSISKIAEYLNSIIEIDAPIDIVLRNLVHTNALKGFVAFPFLTSLSSLSESSTVQPKLHAYTETIWHAFRKLIWIDGTVNAIKNNLEIIEAGIHNEESNALSIIISGTLSKNFISK
jgi:GR25 family glycosyltransferase involved in LPS biosynthesis